MLPDNIEVKIHTDYVTKGLKPRVVLVDSSNNFSIDDI